MLDIRERNGKVKHAELPVDQPSAVAFTAFADVWPRATETEMGAALCAIGVGRTLNMTYYCMRHIVLDTIRAYYEFNSIQLHYVVVL